MTVADDDQLDPATVAALYLEHGEQLQRFLVGLLRDPQLAADVLQATFAKVVQVGHTTQSETRKAWLFRVAYHEAMAIRRRESVGQRIVERVAWSVDTHERGADEPLVRFETAEGVRQALNELPPDQQRVVRMRIYEEKTFAVIAEELQIPLGTALARMRSALKKLRDKLKSQHDS